jgi:hypothetical protein
MVVFNRETTRFEWPEIDERRWAQRFQIRFFNLGHLLIARRAMIHAIDKHVVESQFFKILKLLSDCVEPFHQLRFLRLEWGNPFANRCYRNASSNRNSRWLGLLEITVCMNNTEIWPNDLKKYLYGTIWVGWWPWLPSNRLLGVADWLRQFIGCFTRFGRFTGVLFWT